MYPIIDKIETGNRLRQLMCWKGITVKDIKEFLALACVQSVYHWLDGKSLPTIDNLYALSELFQVPIDEMICGNRQSEKKQFDLSFKTRLMKYYSKISEMHAA